ncbi:aldo/keto reductase [Commensalibacter sp. M0391]|nr:aldo/keto reductase [Commensalibacter melissae]MBI0016852.1 aldo/keto reductase [Commensalibacter sp. B14384M2]MBI0018597.1 aldo/keto reductase [Commensalibacter sp. W8133]MBI0050021.1 aldo/keto reductase [Commensalibacter sp. B14384M3]MBI0179205.1 aldo/keto reductase [Commensalibacter sp. W8163]
MYQTLQSKYNLYDNPQFDDTLRNLVIRKNIGVIIYYSLNSGFLTGKYRNYKDMITVREMTRLPHT